MNFQKEIKEKIIFLATMNNRQINEVFLNGFIEALNDLDEREILFCLNDWVKTSKGFPFPSEIRSKIDTPVSDEDKAQRISNLILDCQRKFGYTNKKQAEEYMGEAAWRTVNELGGWQLLCETTMTDQLTSNRAQFKNSALSVLRRAKSGVLDEKISIPQSTKSEMGKLISETMKGINYDEKK